MINNVKFIGSMPNRNVLLNRNAVKNHENDYDLNNYNYFIINTSINNSQLGIDYLQKDQYIDLLFKTDFIHDNNISNIDYDFERSIVTFDVQLDFYEMLERVEINSYQINKNDFRKLFPNAKFIKINNVFSNNSEYYIYDLGDGVRRKGYFSYHQNGNGLGLYKSIYRKYLSEHINNNDDGGLELDISIANLTDLETDFVSEISDDTLEECLLKVSDKERFDHNNISMYIKNKDNRLKLAKYLWDSKRSGINGHEFPSLNMKKYYIDKFLYLEPYYELIGKPVENCGEFFFRSNVNIRTVEIENIENTVSTEAIEFIKNVREIDHIDDKKVYYIDKNGNHRNMKVLKVGRNTPDFVLLPRSFMVY